jgi:hypothetical protein
LRRNPDERRGSDADTEEEPDTEHEVLPAEDQNEVDVTFGPRDGRDARMIERMNALAAILKSDNVTGEDPVEARSEARMSAESPAFESLSGTTIAASEQISGGRWSVRGTCRETNWICGPGICR